MIELSDSDFTDHERSLKICDVENTASDHGLRNCHSTENQGIKEPIQSSDLSNYNTCLDSPVKQNTNKRDSRNKAKFPQRSNTDTHS